MNRSNNRQNAILAISVSAIFILSAVFFVHDDASDGSGKAAQSDDTARRVAAPAIAIVER